MLERTMSVLRNKNKREKEDRNRRKQELMSVQNEAAFKAKLYDDLKKDIDIVLKDNQVKSVIVSIPTKHLGSFMKAIYSEEMLQYNVEQTEENKFEISKKTIRF